MVEYEQQQPFVPQQVYPSSNALFNKPQEENNFLQEVFNFSEHLNRLTHYWNGDEYDRNGEWVINKLPERQLMNEKGVNWCKCKLRPYTSSNYVVTNFNIDEINNIMRPIANNINHELHKRYIEFGFRDKLDIKSVWTDMVMFIYAILKGNFADAQRKFLSTTNQYNIVEHKDTSPSRGWFSSANTKATGQQ